MEYKPYFIAESKVAAYLQLFNLESSAISLIKDRVQNYNPETELLLLINQNGRIEINLLQNMAISPPECYRQMQQRQSEFQFDLSTSRKIP